LNFAFANKICGIQNKISQVQDATCQIADAISEVQDNFQINWKNLPRLETQE